MDQAAKEQATATPYLLATRPAFHLIGHCPPPLHRGTPTPLTPQGKSSRQFVQAYQWILV